VGKTEYALSYAESRQAEIVSCDASLVYRGMDIGTAKPSPEELSRVPHHLIDVQNVDQTYDIVAYQAAAEAAIAEIEARGSSVVVTGGSGFYLKSFLAPVTDSVVVSTEIRSEVAAIDAAGGLSAMLERLRGLNPDGFGVLDTLNPRRVMRALERCLASGRTLLELQAEFASRPEPYPEYEKYLILLERDPESLRERVAQRVDLMLAAGLIEEVRALLDKGIESNPSAASAIGYRETLSYINGDVNIAELRLAIIQNTMHLVKKQRTWFRSQIREPDEQIILV
jgi:tRNA dimethylallyltransferase